jgi:hypothetical protein
MNSSLPRPALVAAFAAALALPFSIAAAGTLLLTAALGAIIHADYVLRHKRVRLPRLAIVRKTSDTRPTCRDQEHPLAA